VIIYIKQNTSFELIINCILSYIWVDENIMPGLKNTIVQCPALVILGHGLATYMYMYQKYKYSVGAARVKQFLERRVGI
jgi:hypothetical protein